MNKGGNNVPVVISSLLISDGISDMNDEMTADFFYSPTPDKSSSLPEKTLLITDYPIWHKYGSKYKNFYPSFSVKEFQQAGIVFQSLHFIRANPEELNDQFLQTIGDFDNIVLIMSFQTSERNKLYHAFNVLSRYASTIPVIIQSDYSDNDKELYFLKAASDLGVFFTDGLADGLWLNNPNFSPGENTHLAFRILQAARARIFKTEYIACPSCGRTLFNIQDTLAGVKKSTQHLKHLKIAVMGCIVNGPGEMADADYGFVGSAPGKITLYKEKEAIKKNIPVQHAIDELINLIKENGDWIEK